jgi:hypothetical protein
VPREQQDFGGPAMRHRQKSGDQVRDDGDQRNLRALVRQFNVEGAQELLDALAAPNPQGTVPYCGCQPLHVAKHLPSRVNFDDLHYVLQLTQARALTLAVEWFRSRHPRNMGVLYWQLNDCRPGGTTWSCIDGDGRPKPVWYATRRFYAGYVPTIQPEPDGTLSLYLIVVSNIYARRFRFEDEELASQRVDCQIAPRSVHRVPLHPSLSNPEDPSREFIYFGDEIGTYWFFSPDRELLYPEPRFTCDLEREGDTHYLRLGAQSLMRDVCLFVDRIDPEATISDQLVTLFPDEIFTFAIQSKKDLTLEQLTTRPVLQLVRPRGALSQTRSPAASCGPAMGKLHHPQPLLATTSRLDRYSAKGDTGK